MAERGEITVRLVIPQHLVRFFDLEGIPTVEQPMRDLLLGAPGQSADGPRWDSGGSQRDRLTPASRVPPYRAPESGGVAVAPDAAVKGKGTQAGGPRSAPAGRRATPDPQDGARPASRTRVRDGERQSYPRRRAINGGGGPLSDAWPRRNHPAA